MTKVKLILSSLASGLLIWSVSHTSIYENSELNVFRNIKFISEISNNWSKNLFRTAV